MVRHRKARPTTELLEATLATEARKAILAEAEAAREALQQTATADQVYRSALPGAQCGTLLEALGATTTSPRATAQTRAVAGSVETLMAQPMQEVSHALPPLQRAS